MTSIFRARRPPPPGVAAAEDDQAETVGSGGKIIRGRRRLEQSPASRYARPLQRQPTAASPPLTFSSSKPSTESPRWLLGLISGAGKLISSVFGFGGSSSCPSPSSSSEYFSDEDLGDQEEDINQSKELHELNQAGKNLGLQNFVDGSQAIIPLSESKLAIEQLLMRETFSRDECIRLTTLIQSRVGDSPSSKGIQDKEKSKVLEICIGSTSGSPGGWPLMDQKKETSKLVPSSPSNLGTLLPRFPSPLAFAPELHSEAVTEAKKWAVDQKLKSNLKSDIVCGPCTSDTSMLHYDFQGEGSPADLAKSYMQSLPACKTPSIRSSANDEIPSTAKNSLPSFEVFKRKYLTSKLTESPEDTRRVRMRSSEFPLLSPDFGEFCSSARAVENEALKLSSLAG